ncbi:MAG: VWA domain-containing protein [Treponema sp.]|jgi:Ca-activated chloride channel family protein|nr:VWA domain-containing protein [Treponema sp.]
MHISFEHPFLIVVGLMVIILSVPLAHFFKDALTLVVPLGPPGGIPFKPPYNLDIFIKIVHALELLGIFLLFVAAAGPLFISTETVWLNRGADILFVVDVSPSMAALDMEGASRFDTARKLVHDFAANRPSDAIGLVAVGNDAALLVPPTVDRASLFFRLESLAIAELGDGTALGIGLGVAAFHIRNSTAPRKVVVLITDGENNAGSIHPETAAALLPELGASLWVIGVGSDGEVPINYVDPLTKMRRFGTFDSRFDPESLKAIAAKGNGVYIRAPSADAFARGFSRIDQGEMTIGRSGTLTRTRSLAEPFIITTLILLIAVRVIRRVILRAFL